MARDGKIHPLCPANDLSIIWILALAENSFAQTGVFLTEHLRKSVPARRSWLKFDVKGSFEDRSYRPETWQPYSEPCPSCTPGGRAGGSFGLEVGLGLGLSSPFHWITHDFPRVIPRHSYQICVSNAFQWSIYWFSVSISCKARAPKLIILIDLESYKRLLFNSRQITNSSHS